MDYLIVDSVSKTFQDYEVLHGVSLNCKKGEITGIVGHNGSGKSVLFKCICGLLKSYTGTIVIDGKVLGKDMDMPESLGAIIEAPQFIGKYSGLKNLKLLYMLKNKPNDAYLKEILATVGLDPKLKKPVSKYSMGMKQRLAIAQAIMDDPDLIILDEPTNGLDHVSVADMRTLFLDLKEKGKTILIASHNNEDIRALCDQVYEMEMGNLKLVED